MKKNFLIVLAVPFLLASCRNLTDDDTYSSELKKLEAEAQDDNVKLNEILATETLTAKVVDYYHLDDDNLNCDSQKITLYFSQDGEIPFVEVKSFVDFWIGPQWLSVKKEGKKYILSVSRNANYNLTIDFSTGEIAYSDYDWFCSNKTSVASCDIISDDTFFKRKAIMDIQAAKAYTRNLNDYGIPFKYEGGHGFIPLEVAQLITNCGIHVAYNGQAAFKDTDDAWKNPAYSQKFSNPKETWSEAFGKYSYNFLCLAMDMKYGRKAYKGITTFDNWLTASGLKDALSSTKIKDSEKALGTMLLANIGDLHTYYRHSTPYFGLTSKGVLNKNEVVLINSSEVRFNNNMDYLNNIAKKQTSFMICNDSKKIMNIFIPRITGSSAEEKAKYNTIFLAFSEFESSNSYDYYKKNWAYTQIGGKKNSDGIHFYVSEPDNSNPSNLKPLKEISDDNYTVDNFLSDINANPGNGYGISFKNELDTILLTIVSNYIIKELNKGNGRKIDNVVLDLSRNGGGSCDDEIFIASWFLGQADNHLKNTITGSTSSVSFVADVDFDGIYNKLYQYAYYERTKQGEQLDLSKINDPDDTVCNLKRYCITSLWSFSCGNLLPAHIADKDTVTIIGQKSGGGTCAVVTIEMPSGTRFCTSSPWQFSRLVNGSLVDIDDGIFPEGDVATSDFDKIYNRETFCETYIN